MKRDRWQSIARSWTGIVAAGVAVIMVAWLFSVFVHAWRVTPIDKATIDSLKEKAKTDAEVQKILQPELQRQQAALVRRRNVYNRCGPLALIALGVFFAWFKWFRPADGKWEGVPRWLLAYLQPLPADPVAETVIEVKAAAESEEEPGEDYCALGDREGCKRFMKVGPCDLPECPMAVAERKKAGTGAPIPDYVFEPVDPRIYGVLSSLTVGRLSGQPVETNVSDSKHGNGHRGPAGLNMSRAAEAAADGSIEIRIGLGSCGIASGAREVWEAIENAVAATGNGLSVKAVGCSGQCHNEPLVEVIENGRRALYGGVVPEAARTLVRKHIAPRGVLRRVREEFQIVRELICDDKAWGRIERLEIDASPCLGKQVRLVLENCGEVRPLSISDYRSHEGMKGLEECLARLLPEEVIAQVRASGLRCREGQGVLVADTLDAARVGAGTRRAMICRADERDAGSFAGRAILESDPFRVIEGMAIAAYAIGAGEGFLCIRPQDGFAARQFREAIAVCEAEGLLGESLVGRSFGFRLQLAEVPEIPLCNDEAAFVESIKFALVTLRSPIASPGQAEASGILDHIINVETAACLPWIMRRGAAAFAAIGTEQSRGTKVFSLVGKVNRGGLIEVPMGITLREIVEEIGGGIKAGNKFKAALIGGPSGGCIPAQLAETRIGYEELASAGASMQSTGLVVFDDHDCAVDIARYFLHLAESASCGKCAFCQTNKRMLEVVDRICEGKGRKSDLRTLEDLSLQLEKGRTCGPTQRCPNPVLSTLRHFRDEYEAHIRDQRCPAAVCKALIRFRVLDSCTGCTLCAQACPVDAIQARPYLQHEVIDDRCTRCGMCVTACPEDAIEVV